MFIQSSSSATENLPNSAKKVIQFPESEASDALKQKYEKYCRPDLVSRLKAASLDIVYQSAAGDYLEYQQGNESIKVLDLAGGYGANILGHYHPELMAYWQQLVQARVPILAQGSCRSGAAQLAEALAQHLGDYVTLLTNSGAETIEAAIKHAFLERPRPLLWAVKGAFHGKTLGAIQLTWSFREPYEQWGPPVHYLDPQDPNSWQEAEKEAENVSAAFIEPILGEGGIKSQPKAFLDWLAQICQQNNIPIIADEIQTGMGRTGRLLASESWDFQPDYLCLAKSLGGGLVKIGALMIKRERLVSEFSLKHSSTFGEDDLSALIGLKTWEIIQRDQLPQRCAKLGDRLLQQLRELQAQYPQQIKDVRGQGLMIGLELCDQSESVSNTLRMISQHQYLGYFAAAYLLHVHRIRIMPTLSQPFTLRIQPSAYITESALDQFVGAIAAWCKAVKGLDIVHLMSFQVDLPTPPITMQAATPTSKREQPQTQKKVAFLAHLITAEDAALCDPALSVLTPKQQQAFLDKTAQVMGPTLFDSLHVTSQTGETAHLSFLGLPLTSQHFQDAWRTRQTHWLLKQIEEAAILAKQQGCQVLGLGGYTSILTRNGRRLKTPDLALTTGNALTIGMGILSLQKAAKQLNIDASTSTLAIIGATGNISATYALMMAPQVKKLLLIVRRPASEKLNQLQAQLKNVAPSTQVVISDQLADLRDCSLIVSASNSAEPLIYPQHLSSNPVVICDISLPSDVAPEISQQRPDVLAIQGGVVRLPHNPDFRISGIPLPPGYAFACMSETLLMGLEGMKSHGSYGAISTEQVFQSLAIAEKHGFTLGSFQTQQAY